MATLADPPVAHAYLRRELYSGVTTVRDMAGDVRLLSELKRAAEFDELVSPDIYGSVGDAITKFWNTDTSVDDTAKALAAAIKG